MLVSILLAENILQTRQTSPLPADRILENIEWFLFCLNRINSCPDIAKILLTKLNSEIKPKSNSEAKAQYTLKAQYISKRESYYSTQDQNITPTLSLFLELGYLLYIFLVLML
ncbi:hypothetical protein PS15p_202301 [Mucor circinelloides]